MSAQPACSPTVLKVTICIISFGMIFRNIMHD